MNNNCTNKLFLLFIITFLAIAGAFYFCLKSIKNYSLAKSHLDANILVDKLSDKIDAKLEQCGEGFWISVIVINGINSYYWQDAKGCTFPAPECGVYSLKEKRINPDLYNAIHYDLDLASYQHMQSFPTGAVAITNSIDSLKEFKTFYDIVKNRLNVDINLAAYSVAKDDDNNVVYLFTFSSSSKSPSVCLDRKNIEPFLKDLAITAKNQM